MSNNVSSISSYGTGFLVFFLVLSVLVGMFEDLDKPADITARIKYSKDIRTGLCFGMVTISTFGGRKSQSIASVPCTKEVEALITK